MAIPELRTLIACAREYVAGNVHFSFVCADADKFAFAAKHYNSNPAIRQLAEDWLAMATRVWPELSRIDNPISEEEFKAWVAHQLEVFRPSSMGL